jgi:hypothetical protein
VKIVVVVQVVFRKEIHKHVSFDVMPRIYTTFQKLSVKL